MSTAESLQEIYYESCLGYLRTLFLFVFLFLFSIFSILKYFQPVWDRISPFYGYNKSLGAHTIHS